MMTQFGGRSLYSRSAEKAIPTTRALYHGHSTGSQMVAAKHFCSCREPLRDCAAPGQLRITGSQLGCCLAIGWLNPGVGCRKAICFSVFSFAAACPRAPSHGLGVHIAVHYLDLFFGPCGALRIFKLPFALHGPVLYVPVYSTACVAIP